MWSSKLSSVVKGVLRSNGAGGTDRTKSVIRRFLSDHSTDTHHLVASKDRNAALRKPVRLVSSKNIGTVRPRILVVGSGWGGFTFLSSIDKTKYDVQVVSPSNHFLFTPLLPSSVVGTLEFRAIQEPIRTVKGLNAYYQAKVTNIDPETRRVLCEDIFNREEFEVEYDFLVLACGAKTNTFNTPGIAQQEGEEVFFLKHLYHARQIRQRILECFERAAIHLTDHEERDRLLTFIVVGGGPTNCELVGELHDFITVDVRKWYPDLMPYISIHLVERGPRLLPSFDPSISNIVLNRFSKRDIHVHLGVAVESFDAETKITKLSSGKELPTGMIVWSAGLQQTKFVQNSKDLTKGPGNRIIVNDYLQIENEVFDNRVYAIGDCAINLKEPLAPLAQAANQQARYLSAVFNAAPNGVGLTKPPQLVRENAVKPFKYFSLGSMVTFGNFNGAIDLTAVGELDQPRNFGFIHGVLSYFMWRSAYFLKVNSWTNRLLIPMYWFKSFFLGRDISRF